MPRKESYADETAGTQISISDDFDKEYVFPIMPS
jgi:hypothetical protein